MKLMLHSVGTGISRIYMRNTYIHIRCLHMHIYIHKYIHNTYIHSYTYTYIHTYINKYIHSYIHLHILDTENLSQDGYEINSQ
jgi:hypothetical protein